MFELNAQCPNVTVVNNSVKKLQSKAKVGTFFPLNMYGMFWQLVLLVVKLCLLTSLFKSKINKIHVLF